MLRGIVTLVLMLGLAGCGEERSSYEDAIARREAAESARAEASAAAKEERRAEQAARWRQCKNGTADLVGALQQIDSRLSVGMNKAELGERLGDARVAYDAVPFSRLDSTCTLGVGIGLEDAFNQYLKSLQKWEDCIDDLYCQVEGQVLAGMRKHWTEAGQRLAYVERVLASAKAFAKVKGIRG